MTPNERHKRWPAKRIAALLLTLTLVGLGLYTWRAGVGDRQTLVLLGFGSAWGLLYTIRGGSLPPLIYKLGEGKITADDDPSNLSPKFYLPGRSFH